MKDVWQIDMVGRTSSERTGYATQKPEALLERIVACSSREGDICADFFCGSGTLAAVARKMNRRWICCDEGQLAAAAVQKRIMAENNEAAEESVLVGDVFYGKLQACREQAEAGSGGRSRCTIRLTGLCMDPGWAKRLDEEHREKLRCIQEMAPLQLIDFWSIDTDSEGGSHRSANVFLRDKKGKMELKWEGLLSEQEAKRTISVVAVDVLGNRYRCLLKP